MSAKPSTPYPALLSSAADAAALGAVLLAADGASEDGAFVKVTPRGPVRSRDGRDYVFGPEGLASGREALAARAHRYVWPTFHHDAEGRATWLPVRANFAIIDHQKSGTVTYIRLG